MNVTTVVKRILTALLSLLLILYVGYQGYKAIYNPFRTTRATVGTFQDIISADSYVLRSETPITYTGGGVLDYVKDDGEAVSSGGEVAAVYGNEQAAENSRKLKKLQEQLDTYNELNEQKVISNTDLSYINSTVKNSFLELCEASSDKNIEEIQKQKTEMLELLNRKQLATGEDIDYSSQITEINSKIANLSTSTDKQISSISAPNSGYFVSKVDGFENSFDLANVKTISSTDVDKLLNLEPSIQANSVGKIINTYESYIVCNVSNDDAYKLKEGETRKLHFLYSSIPEISATITAINKDSHGISVVFKCTTMSNAYSLVRKQKIEIVSSNYKGIKVSNNLIHIVDGQKGVYIRSGNLVSFKKIDTIYSQQGFSVSRIVDNDDSYLQIYDEIITNGDDLYDGKTIK